MKIVVIGGDRRIFDPQSENFLRIRNYADLFEELHIIVFTDRKYRPKIIDSRLFLWPTRSFSPFLRWFDAIIISLRLSRAHSINLIDAENPGEAGFAAFCVSKITSIPFRIQVHTDIFSTFYQNASWKENFRYHMSKFLIPRADCIRAVSQRVKRSLLKFGGEKLTSRITILPIFTDISRFFEAEPDRQTRERFKNYEFKMLAVGRFVDKEKNFSMLIGMMHDFVKVCPKALLVLVGDGPDEESYKGQVTRNKLENHVKIEPWRDDLPSFYKSFDLYLMSSNFEGWGRTVIEAMAAGLPVLMTDVGVAGEVVQSELNGIVVPPQNKVSFLNSIKDLCLNPEKRRFLAEAGLKTARDLTPQNHTEYLQQYYEALNSCTK